MQLAQVFPITIEDRKYELRFNLNALCAVQNVIGRNPLEIIADLQEWAVARAKEKREAEEAAEAQASAHASGNGDSGGPLNDETIPLDPEEIVSQAPQPESQAEPESFKSDLRGIPIDPIIMRALLWGCLHDRDGEPTVTIGHAGALLTPATIALLQRGLLSVVAAAFPDASASPLRASVNAAS